MTLRSIPAREPEPRTERQCVHEKCTYWAGNARKNGAKRAQIRPILPSFTFLWRLPERLSRFSACLERDFFAYCSSNLLFVGLQAHESVGLQADFSIPTLFPIP